MKKQISSAFYCFMVLCTLLTSCEKSPPDRQEESVKKKAQTVSEGSNFTVNTFVKEPIANASVVAKKFTFPKKDDLNNVKKILMHVYLNCPSVGCPAWDVFANVRLLKSNGDDTKNYGYELGRWITPYGRDNSSISGGWVVDVTDFRSLLIGDVTLETRAEVYSGTWQVSIDFEYITGTPQYLYSAVVPIMEYNAWSKSGVHFGAGTVTANTYNGKQTGFSVNGIPDNIEQTSFRTIISGWGHAQPYAQDSRGFAEWAFRKHKINIDDKPTFTHDMGSLGCATNINVVKNQYGNWTANRAGWCPGMEVPIRKDVLTQSMLNGFNFNYVLQEDQWDPNNLSQKWKDNGVNPDGAYYALSTYLIIESNTPIASLPAISNR